MSSAGNHRRLYPCPAATRVRRWAGLLLIVLALAGGESAGRAADSDAILFPSTATTPDVAPQVAGLTQGLNSLTLLVAAAFAATGGWALWRHRHGTAIRAARPALALDETRALGNRQYLVVASYEGRKFLLGVCPGRIDLLAPLTTDSPPPPAK
jgi:flagellar protein FliO/FliZ